MNSRNGSNGFGWTPLKGEVGIRVRMYRVGFGDFFLITCLDRDQNPLHIIVDCGVYKGTSQTGDIKSIEAAVQDMEQITGGNIELIIMTHRHADHIAGFARCADIFKRMTIGDIWMPIWESEYEPIAVKYQAELTRMAFGLVKHFASLNNATEAQQIAKAHMENAIGEPGSVGVSAVARLSANEKALDLLKRGFPGVKPKYYKRGDKAKLSRSLSKAGLECEILGPPPATAIDLMKLMDLQKNVGQYLAAPNDADPNSRWAPFEKKWELANPPFTPLKGESEPYASESFREWSKDPRKTWGEITNEEAKEAREKMEAVLQELQPVASLAAAKQLNAFLNNQSLVVLFKFKGKSLLFVGDAQAGNWQHWLYDTDVPDKHATGVVSPGARSILTSLDFYKVGHHGSTNSTPKVAAETMSLQTRKFVSMCPTQAGVYGNEDFDDPSKGTEVPRLPLLEKLAAESALVRSDQIEIKVNGKITPPQVDNKLPEAPLGSRLETGTLWVDCYL